MKIKSGTIDLVHEEKSTIKYTLIDFSDSQSQIVLYVTDLDFSECDSMTIVSYMRWEDVQHIICATKALRHLGVKVINLYVPYFLGARSDRLFNKGSTHYLKDVICPIINSLNFSSVIVLDPHSSALEGCLDNLVIDSITYMKFIINAFTLHEAKYGSFLLVAPDAGAKRKVEILSEKTGIPYISCSKLRDPDTGRVIKTKVNAEGSLKGNNYLIIDDICDGGATFVGVANALRKQGADSVSLAVTHGIFSKGFSELFETINRIYTTNSFPRELFEPFGVSVYDVFN